MIRISPLRVIGPDGQMIGVLENAEAQQMARENGLDLVEIQPDVRPPVCKIMDYGKFRYETTKREQKNKASSKQAEMKEIRLGRSIKIDPHDVQIRVDQARRFLMQGHKVQITQRFRGREMMHKELGLENLQKFVDDLEDISKIDSPPRWANRAASLILSPDRDKVEAIKRREAKEAAEAAEQDATVDAVEAPQDDKPTPGREDKDVHADKKAKKGPKDDRARNPVDDELEALLEGD